MPPPATAGLIRPFFKRKQCLHPLASRDVCGKVIAAHTIQRQGALASIVDGTGHCLTFYRAMGQDVSEPQRRGWREASTFAGFCEHHDSKAFAPLEGKPFVGSREQCFLMAYRAECHELYQKQASSRSLARLRQIVDRGLSPADQIAVQEIQRALRDGVLKSINNSKRYKRIMDSQFLERRFDAYEKLFVQFDGPLAFAAAGAPTPNRSLSGEELCALHDPEAVIPRLYVGMARAAYGDAVVFVWRKGEPAPLGREVLAQIASVATPATLLRWYRHLIAAKYDGSKNRSPGRPPTAKDIRELIVRVARENPTWGYTRLRGALKSLGHELGRNTIKRVLAEHGIAPAPERGKSMSWSTFIKAHWGAIAATDLFTVEVVNPFGLVRYHVLFVIDIATRCVCIGGITSDPNGEWMKQVARNLTDMWDGFLLGKRYLIRDRDPLFTEAVRGLLRDSGVKPLRLPAKSPNLNAYAERFVLSIRRECLDRFVPLSERHLRTAVTEYVVHYHTERNHQGLGNELITPLPASANDAGPIVSRERLGGILNYYYRAA